MAYLTLSEFTDLALLSPDLVTAVETIQAGWIEGQLEHWSAHIDARLAKRYATPFSSPYPVTVKGWLARIVAVRVYLRRGVDATDEQFLEIRNDARDALDEIEKAADAQHGLYELPLRADTTANGVTRGDTWSYSEQSPYVGLEQQRTTGRTEDSNGSGSFG